MRPFIKPHIEVIPDGPTKAALRNISDFNQDVDALIARNFQATGGGAGVTVLQPSGSGAFDYDLLTNIPWTNEGASVVRLTVASKKVGVGVTAPGARVEVRNQNTTDDLLLLTNAATRSVVRVTKAGGIYLGNATDTSDQVVIMIGNDALVSTGSGSSVTQLTWGDNVNNLSGPGTTVGMVSVAGARMVMFKDPTGTYDAVYGQSFADNWVQPGPEDITYSIFSGKTPPGTSFIRAQWAGNGDYTNYGFVKIKKNANAAIPSTPALILEETGAGTDAISVRAPAAVASGTRVQLLQDLVGTFVMVGDDPPAIASKALGKVDLTGQTAAIASTNLSNGPLAGVYVVHIVAECTTASGAGAPTLDVNVAWTDTLGATNRNATADPGATAFPLPLSATGRSAATFVAQVASGNISYSTTINAAAGSPQYAIYIRVVCLG